MITHFSFGGERASHEFVDDVAALAFAERMTEEIAKWEFGPDLQLRVEDHGGNLIFARRFRCVLAPQPILNERMSTIDREPEGVVTQTIRQQNRRLSMLDTVR